MKIVTANEMKQLDLQATSVSKIPPLLLMENAARGFVDRMERLWSPLREKRVTVVSGRGNNGGDGIAAAWHLKRRGALVAVYLLAPAKEITGESRIFLDIWIASGGVLHEIRSSHLGPLVSDLTQAHIVVDALLGTGLSHPVTGLYADVIRRINESNRTVVSVDIPSGISADTGERLGVAIKANNTFTIGLPKRGIFLREGPEHRGTWEGIDIGIPSSLVERAVLNVALIEPMSLCRDNWALPQSTHKGMRGHLLVIAGSTGKRGAALMTSLAALRSGAGMVTLALPKSLDRPEPQKLLDQINDCMPLMTLPLSETEEGTLALSSSAMLFSAAQGKGAIAIGPGLSQHIETQHLIRKWVTEVSIPMVVDADGINALAGHLEILRGRKGPLILTPHPGEMGRLIGASSEAVQKDRIGIASSFAHEWNLILVLKGAHTVVALPNQSVWINRTGNPGMATAGTGDVLTGIIASLLAQRYDPDQAALWGVYLHGLAGDMAMKEVGENSLIATDLLNNIPKAILQAIPTLPC